MPFPRIMEMKDLIPACLTALTNPSVSIHDSREHKSKACLERVSDPLNQL